MKIAVLMSTYNGEKYLKEQIESILSQKLPPSYELVLFIRDDGSSDRTCRIIDNFTERFEKVVRVSSSVPAHLGIKESFLLVLETAFVKEGGFDYYAFSDQDDIWLEDKLTAAIEKLEKSSNEKGALYYSNKFIADCDLRMREKENIRYYGDFTEILWMSKAYGNTMVFNDCLAEYALLHHTQVASYHDAWVYRLAKCIGADIFFDEDSYIFYRQHPGNAVGYKSKPYSGWIHMVKNFFPNLVKPREHFIQNQIKEIYEFYQQDLDQKVMEEIDLVMNYNKNIKLKRLFLMNSDMKKRSVLERCIWTYKILFNMI